MTKLRTVGAGLAVGLLASCGGEGAQQSEPPATEAPDSTTPDTGSQTGLSSFDYAIDCQSVVSSGEYSFVDNIINHEFTAENPQASFGFDIGSGIILGFALRLSEETGGLTTELIAYETANGDRASAPGIPVDRNDLTETPNVVNLGVPPIGDPQTNIGFNIVTFANILPASGNINLAVACIQYDIDEGAEFIMPPVTGSA